MVKEGGSGAVPTAHAPEVIDGLAVPFPLLKPAPRHLEGPAGAGIFLTAPLCVRGRNPPSPCLNGVLKPLRSVATAMSPNGWDWDTRWGKMGLLWSQGKPFGV